MSGNENTRIHEEIDTTRRWGVAMQYRKQAKDAKKDTTPRQRKRQ